MTRDSLRGAQAFDCVFSRGRKGSRGCALARIVLAQDAGPSKLGLIVPKKKAKRAVERNAFKRVAREAFLDFLRQRPDQAPPVEAIVQFTGCSKELLANLDQFKRQARADIDLALASASPVGQAQVLPLSRH